jgi:beta-glucosidase
MGDPEAEKVFNELLSEYLEGTDLYEMLGGRKSEMMEAMLKYMPLRALVMFSEGAVSRQQVEEMVKKLNKNL